MWYKSPVLVSIRGCCFSLSFKQLSSEQWHLFLWINSHLNIYSPFPPSIFCSTIFLRSIYCYYRSSYFHTHFLPWQVYLTLLLRPAPGYFCLFYAWLLLYTFTINKIFAKEKRVICNRDICSDLGMNDIKRRNKYLLLLNTELEHNEKFTIKRNEIRKLSA